MAEQTPSERSTSHHTNGVNRVARFLIAVVLIVAALLVYRWLIRDIITGRSYFWAFLVLWLFTAYLVLPRINRALTKLYLPNYFIGRSRTGDGLLGDPINLAIDGEESQLITAMEAAGWVRAVKITPRSMFKMAVATILGRSYPEAPVSPLYLFSERQHLAFERDLHNSPRRRHHVRFWRTPENWWLPGGHKADWLGAATFDKHVGFSLFTGQVTHKIASNVDHERDFVVSSLERTGLIANVDIIEHFTSGYHGRNGGGDKMETDGALPFVKLK